MTALVVIAMSDRHTLWCEDCNAAVRLAVEDHRLVAECACGTTRRVKVAQATPTAWTTRGDGDE